MTKNKLYKCKENDNKIKVITVDGKIDEVWFKAAGDKGWTVIGINDLNSALNIKYNK